MDSGLTKKELYSILEEIFPKAPTKEKPFVWMIKGGVQFKNDGEKIYVLLESDVWDPITQEEYKQILSSAYEV